ncbi:MAG: biotin--[acetyl-CoA-carboxylase] ligase [Salinivirgaceae bacterium]|nr:biotin--[acetyl-CoA-carboxylase] ligase [Salinivirgaceae bacterium]
MENEMILWLDSATSTNDILRSYVNKPNGFCVAAKQQSLGRGQRGNVWQSEKEANILSSFLFSISAQVSNSFVISMLTSLAIVQFLEKLQCKAYIKWPNDIIVGNQKIAGMLIENDLLGEIIEYSIIGIGLNVNQKKFENLPKATSLHRLTGKRYDIPNLISMLRVELLAEFDANQSFEIVKKRYLEKLYQREKAKYFNKNDQFVAKVMNVEPDGALVLMTTDAVVKKFYFKEIEMDY